MLILQLCVVLVLALSVLGVPLDHVSFVPPYAEVDSAGDRIVNKHWRTGGTTEVMKSFIRITPDRQSKRGSVWSRTKIGQNEMSTIVKFRISGQGKNFFGDGIGLWFTDSAFWSEGELHGGQESFTGVAIIFDTFKNTENLSQHRDVSVLVNDGKKTYEVMKQNILGCNTSPSVRYHNERADFQVTDASRAHISFQGNILTIKIDAKNNGEWQDCVNFSLSELPIGWLSNSYMGITASTGQLADNHDVLSVISNTDIQQGQQMIDTEKMFVEKGGSAATLAVDPFPPIPNSPMEARVIRMEDAIRDIFARVGKLELEAEHNEISSSEKIGNIIGKLSKREDESERRIDVIEQVVREKIAEHFDFQLEGRLAEHTDSLRADIEETVSNIAEHIDVHVADLRTKGEQYTADASSLKDKMGELAGGHSGWGMSVYFLLIVILAFGSFATYHIKYLYKLYDRPHLG